MKLSEYIEKYGDKKVDLDKMNELIVEDNKEWFPELGERYFYCDSYGSMTTDVYREDDMEISLLERQKPCKTKEEAEFEDAKKVFLSFMEVEFKNNSDVLDWEDDSIYKYHMYYAHNINRVSTRRNLTHQNTTYYTTNEEWLEKFIKNYPTEIEMYYFGINK